MGCWPEKDGAETVEGEAHENGDFVTFSLHDFGCDRGEEEVAASEVDDLKTGGLEFGDVEDGLEMFVENIEEAV